MLLVLFTLLSGCTTTPENQIDLVNTSTAPTLLKPKQTELNSSEKSKRVATDSSPAKSSDEGVKRKLVAKPKGIERQIKHAQHKPNLVKANKAKYKKDAKVVSKDSSTVATKVNRNRRPALVIQVADKDQSINTPVSNDDNTVKPPIDDVKTESIEEGIVQSENAEKVNESLALESNVVETTDVIDPLLKNAIGNDAVQEVAIVSDTLEENIHAKASPLPKTVYIIENAVVPNDLLTINESQEDGKAYLSTKSESLKENNAIPSSTQNTPDSVSEPTVDTVVDSENEVSVVTEDLEQNSNADTTFNSEKQVYDGAASNDSVFKHLGDNGTSFEESNAVDYGAAQEIEIVSSILEENVDTKGSSRPKEIYIVENAVAPNDLLTINESQKDAKAHLSAKSESLKENNAIPSSTQNTPDSVNEPTVETAVDSEDEVSVVTESIEQNSNTDSTPNSEKQAYDGSVDNDIVFDSSSADEASPEENNDAFVLIKEGDSIEKIPAMKTDINNLFSSLDAILKLNWKMLVPNEEQRGDHRFKYCFQILEKMRGGEYLVFPPYNVSPKDYNRWQQKLGRISLVQLASQSLNFYHVKKPNGKSINMVETVFETDEKLSEMLVGVQKNNYYFSGVLSFGVNSQQSLGGVGRFHSEKALNSLSWYLLEWNQNYYALRLQKNGRNYDVMEVIPLLYQQQKHQRNCRWKNVAQQ